MEISNNEVSHKEIASYTLKDLQEEISKRLKTQVPEEFYNDVAVLVTIATHLGYKDGVNKTLKYFENLVNKLNGGVESD